MNWRIIGWKRIKSCQLFLVLLKIEFVGMKIRFQILIALFGLVLFACEKPSNKINISRNGENNSHFSGRNCMSCHYTEGEGEGWFYVGGTIHGNYNGGKIVLFPEGFENAPSDSIEIDDLGNVFTTEFIDFSKGMNVAVINSNGDSLKMPAEIPVGQCNMCHGKTVEPINMY